MAKKLTPKQEPKAEAKEPKQPQGPTRYTKSELIANAAYFKVKPEVMAGALHDVKDATKAEAEKRIKEFLTKGVK